MSAEIGTEAVNRELGELLQLITEVAAPTFEEAERAQLIARLWTEAGLAAEVDPIDNVFARAEGGEGPRVLLAAHSDTVFPAGTDVTVQRAGGRWLAPGIGDNAASLAVLTYLARQLPGLAGPLPRLSFASPVGEEGRGDLRGMRRLLEDHVGEFDYVIAIDGTLGSVTDRAVGSRRFEFTVRAGGGHSWGDYGGASAVHALAGAMNALVTELDVPSEPRSSFNLGTVHGGTSINAIAEEAHFDLDMRSVDSATLDAMEAQAMSLVRSALSRFDVSLEIEKIGDRPTANLDNSALVRVASAALREHGVEPHTGAASTDSNAALAAGIPSVCFGVYTGGDAHRLSEWLDPRSLSTGYAALASLLRGMVSLD